jgi:hypothetical protein
LCYLGLLSLGKNDFEAVEGFRSQRFAHQALGLRAVPSSATLRHRFDAKGTEWSELADQINRAVLSQRINGAPIDFGSLSTGHLPLDIDTFVMDQSNTQKEGVSWTYAGVDGYCPIALYLGTRGYCLELDLRAGSQHSACESEYNIERALGTACAVSAEPLLLPEYVLEGWSTTLGPEIADEAIIALYRDHATHEQFHAEFKTDMGLERLPSGKFATNHLVCALAAVAMNLLRLVGQHTLHESDSPLRKSALRRRIKTVMQEMMFKAARIISHARGWALGISGSDSGFAVFERAHAKMRAA